MRAWLAEILGSYTPQGYYAGDVFISYDGLAGVDWEYVFTGFAFIVVIFCTFKMIGALVTGGNR